MRIANKPASESAPGTHRSEARPLYEPPRLRSPHEGPRRTTWLEFFFDLVFVVAVDQLARRLQNGVTGHELLVYLALYAPVWWAWVGFVMYTDRFGTDDISDRFLTLLQIGAVLVLAAAAMHATSDRAVAFAIAYGVFRLILAARYAIAAHHVREARSGCVRESIGFAVAGAMWIASAAVPAPWRFWMWGAGFAIDLVTPFASPRMHHIVPPDPDHIEERFGTFINISLGEGFIGLVESMRDQPWSGAVLATASLSLLIGFSIWWGFFDTLDQVFDRRGAQAASDRSLQDLDLRAASACGRCCRSGHCRRKSDARCACPRARGFIAMAGLRDGGAVLRGARHRAHCLREGGCGTTRVDRRRAEDAHDRCRASARRTRCRALRGRGCGGARLRGGRADPLEHRGPGTCRQERGRGSRAGPRGRASVCVVRYAPRCHSASARRCASFRPPRSRRIPAHGTKRRRCPPAKSVCKRRATFS